LRETRYEVFKQFVAYLEMTADSISGHAAPSSTLGFRSGAVAQQRRGERFSGAERRPPAKFTRARDNAFRPMREAERRLIAFMEAAKQRVAATFPMIGQRDQAIFGLFDELRMKDFSPGGNLSRAATPVSVRAKQWRDLAQGVDALSGRPRVLQSSSPMWSAMQMDAISDRGQTCNARHA